MSRHYTDAPEAVALVRCAFPDYKHSAGRLTIRPFTHPVTPTSCWNGGSRDYWAFVALDASKATPPIPENGNGFTPDCKPVEHLPQGFALVRVTIGSFTAAELYVPPENLTPLLPLNVSLSLRQLAVLVATRSLISSARREYCARVGIKADEFTHLQAELRSQGMLNKAGAITTSGRNVSLKYRDFYQIEDEFRRQQQR